MWWFCSFVYIDNVVYSLYSFYVLSKGNEIYERLVCIKAYVVCRRFSKPSRISSLILYTMFWSNFYSLSRVVLTLQGVKTTPLKELKLLQNVE